MRLAHAGFLNGFTVLVRSMLAAATIPLLFGWLGAAGYGTWVFVSAAAGLAALIDLGTGASGAVFLARTTADGDLVGARRVIANSRAIALTCGTMSACLVVATAPFVADLFRTSSASNGTLTLALRLSSGQLFLRLTMSAWIGVEDGLGAFKERTWLALGDSVVGSGALLVAAVTRGTILALACSQVVATAIMFSLHGWVVARLLGKLGIRGPVLASFRGASAQAKMGTGALLGSFSSLAFNQFDRLIVGAAMGPVSLAYYATIMALAGQAQTLCASLLQPLLFRAPRLRTDKAALRDLTRKTVLANTATTAAVVAVGVVGSPLVGRTFSSLAVVPTGAIIAGLTAYGVLAMTAGAHYLVVAEGRTFAVSLVGGLAALVTLAAIYLAANLSDRLEIVVSANVFYGLFNMLTLGLLPRRNWSLSTPSIAGGAAMCSVLALAAFNVFGAKTPAACIALSLTFVGLAFVIYGRPLLADRLG